MSPRTEFSPDPISFASRTRRADDLTFRRQGGRAEHECEVLGRRMTLIERPDLVVEAAIETGAGVVRGESAERDARLAVQRALKAIWPLQQTLEDPEDRHALSELRAGLKRMGIFTDCDGEFY